MSVHLLPALSKVIESLEVNGVKDKRAQGNHYNVK